MNRLPYLILIAGLSGAPLLLTGCEDEVNVEPLDNGQVDETPADTGGQVETPAESTPPGETIPDDTGGMTPPPQ